MKIKLILLLLAATSTYLLTYSSNEWTTNAPSLNDVYENDLPYLNSKERVINLLSNVQYAAVVYPEKSKVYPNSIFHKYILQNPKESTFYTVKAKVIHTIIGESLRSITYSASGSNIGSNAVFVGLCKTKNGFYVPGNGYEFPATVEAIEFVKDINLATIQKSESSACKN